MRWLLVLLLIGASGCSGDSTKKPNSPPACKNSYHPLTCLGGQMVCERRKDGCEDCTCEPYKGVPPPR